MLFTSMFIVLLQRSEFVINTISCYKIWLQIISAYHMEKFAEIWLQLHRFVHSKAVYFYCISFLAQISSHSKYGFQIHKYHEKEQLLENRMIPIEVQ